MIGQTLGHYRIESKLGEGGMGEVYQAVDLRLSRPVALKILNLEGLESSERKKRFAQEARAASSLNHPNIVHIYDIGEAGGRDFIAMEFVAGHTLSEKIARKGLPLREALKYAIQIADGLAKAHAAGIVHRDLKPANIMIGDEGRVKILDFGLAKLLEPESSDSIAATRTREPDQPHTEDRAILGTLAYMSPEQAEGQKVDARSDIFSFASVLYEMVTGRRAFQGQTRVATLSAILQKDPQPVSEIVEELPAELEKLIGRCLRKDPARRIQHMDDVKLALEELQEDSESGVAAALAAPRRAPKRRRIAWVVTAVLLVASITGLAWWLGSRSSTTRSLAGPMLTRLTSDSGLTTDPALSPTGNLFAYASDRIGEGGLDIWVRQIAGGEPIRLTRDPADDHEPAFSPDGSRIAFRSEREGGGVYVVSTLGGDEHKLADFGRRPRFSPDGRWLAYWRGEITNNTTGRVYVVPAQGGPERQFLPNFGWMANPVWSPSGAHVLFLGAPEGGTGLRDWWLAPLEGGEAVNSGALAAFRQQGLTGRFAPDDWIADGNRIVFSAGLGGATNIWEAPLSSGGKVDAPRRLTFGAGLEVQASAGKDGRLLFATRSQNVDVWGVPADTNQGTVTGGPQRLTQDTGADTYPTVSLDGTRIAFTSDRAGRRDVWLKDLTKSTERRLSAGAGAGWWGPHITGDGSRVAFVSSDGQRYSISIVSIDGGVAREVCEDCGRIWVWSPDESFILYSPLGPPWYVALLELASGKKRELVKPKQNVYNASLSQDGRWIAFHFQNRPETRQIFAAAFRNGNVAEDWISITDGKGLDRNCYWSPDGNILYFQSEREGFRCIWAQRLDPATKRPLNAAFPVYHSHHARLTLGNIDPGLVGPSVARDKIVFAQTELTGNIWMATEPEAK